MRDTGACLSPFNAFLLLQGLETLSLRMERQTASALRIAGFLEEHPDVDWVAHAGLPSHPDHALAQQYLPKGAGAVFSFGLRARGGDVRETGRRFIEALQLFSHLANIGDVRSLVIHPASTTHQQLSDDELARAGVAPELIRLSIGLETVEDLEWDLDQALSCAITLNTRSRRRSSACTRIPGRSSGCCATRGRLPSSVSRPIASAPAGSSRITSRRRDTGSCRSTRRRPRFSVNACTLAAGGSRAASTSWTCSVPLPRRSISHAQAIAIGARAFWMQLKLANMEAASLARAAGLDVVADRCIKMEHARYCGRLQCAGMNTEIISARKARLR